MGLRTKIKISSLNNLTEARFYAAAGVEWIGFNFDPLHALFIEPEKAKERSKTTTTKANTIATLQTHHFLLFLEIRGG